MDFCEMGACYSTIEVNEIRVSFISNSQMESEIQIMGQGKGQ